MTEPRKQGYDSKQHSALPYVRKPYKEWLDRISDKQDWTRVKTAEKAIEALGEKTGVE